MIQCKHLTLLVVSVFGVLLSTSSFASPGAGPEYPIHVCGTVRIEPNCGQYPGKVILLDSPSNGTYTLYSGCGYGEDPTVCDLRKSVVDLLEQGDHYCIDGTWIPTKPACSQAMLSPKRVNKQPDQTKVP